MTQGQLLSIQSAHVGFLSNEGPGVDGIRRKDEDNSGQMARELCRDMEVWVWVRALVTGRGRK